MEYRLREILPAFAAKECSSGQQSIDGHDEIPTGLRLLNVTMCPGGAHIIS